MNWSLETFLTADFFTGLLREFLALLEVLHQDGLGDVLGRLLRHDCRFPAKDLMK